MYKPVVKYILLLFKSAGVCISLSHARLARVFPLIYLNTPRCVNLVLISVLFFFFFSLFDFSVRRGIRRRFSPPKVRSYARYNARCFFFLFFCPREDRSSWIIVRANRSTATRRSEQSSRVFGKRLRPLGCLCCNF